MKTIKYIYMKTLLTLFIALVVTFSTYAQIDSTKVKQKDFDQLINSIEKVDQSIEAVDEAIQVLENDEKQKEKKDTVHVRLGKHHVEIVTGDKNAQIDVEKLDDFDSKWDNYDMEINHNETKKHREKRKFDGHWSGWEIGGNQLWDTDYSMYPEGTPAFLETRPEKSFEFNLNIAEYSFGFGSYIGIVTGLGFNFNDYKFKNKYTLIRDEAGILQPEALPEGDFRKSKLSTVFLTAPLMLEIQIPGNFGNDRLFIAGGVIGGVKLGEHTKTKIGNEKLKDKGEFNIAPLRWGYTARIGFENMGLFATYYNTPLFEDGKGPVTTPLTIGLSFNF